MGDLLTTFNCQLSTVTVNRNCQPATVNRQLSTGNRQLSSARERLLRLRDVLRVQRLGRRGTAGALEGGEGIGGTVHLQVDPAERVLRLRTAAQSFRRNRRPPEGLVVLPRLREHPGEIV